MKVFNLRCDQGHRFEGWFASEDDYQTQTGRGLLSCPMCNSDSIERLPSAPRLNLGDHRSDRASEAQEPPLAVSESAQTSGSQAQTPESAAVAALQEQYFSMVRRVLANTEDVGGRFPEEVRRIHYGEAEHRNIRGQADAREREALREEGIEVFALPVPEALKGPLQ